MTDVHEKIYKMGAKARAASRRLADFVPKERANAIIAMAAAVTAARDKILAANALDVSRAAEAGLSAAMTDRLALSESRLDDVIRGLEAVAALPDPLVGVLERRTLPNGLVIEKTPAPIGVIVVIFESRPNVAADAAALCVKSGNAVILRGGKEALESNRVIARALSAGAAAAGFPPDCVQLVDVTDHAAVAELAGMDAFVDLIIPRGGEKLIRAVMSSARVPVLKHYNGICHIYVDASADQAKAIEIIHNAKCQRPGTCNAVESVLVNSVIADEFIPKLACACAKWGVTVKADGGARALAPSFQEALESDWSREYLSLAFSLKIVSSIDEAIEHVNHYGSHHSDAILTADEEAATKFTRRVDSAAVYVNASTRFTDGGEFGMGCEMGISTDKLHARGPVGIRELTTYKYVVRGEWHTRL